MKQANRHNRFARWIDGPLVGGIALTLWIVFGGRAAADDSPIRVMSYNLWQGGDRRPLAQSVAVIQAAKADIVGVQEALARAARGKKRPDNAAKIAAMLGWHYAYQGNGTAVMSRFKVLGFSPKKLGVKLALPSGDVVWHFNCHLAHTPYQPYQLYRIPYNNAPFLNTVQEAVAAARKTHGPHIRQLLAEARAVKAKASATFLTGDFNEPSHQDWTARAVKEGLCRLRVEWPTTKAVTGAGFVDAYRQIHSDEIRRPGRTWTPIKKLTDPRERHDRIDFVFVSGEKVRIRSAQVVGESAKYADIVVEQYPSDHRSVVAEIELRK